MHPYHYFEGASGRRYCYSSQKTERCPLIEHTNVGIALTEQGHKFAAGIDELGQDGTRLLLRAHRSASHNENGKCSCCGSRLETVGYACWIEAPWDQIPADTENLRATRAVNERLGHTHCRVPNSHRHMTLKREAIQWCREQAAIDRASAREELGLPDK